MIDSVKNIYKSEDLHGEFLLQPLKMYHHFFAKKIEDSSGLKKGAWIVANVVTGIFAYPVLSALAGLGMLVKLTGINGLRKHNQSEKSMVDVIQSGVKYSARYATASSSSIIQSEWQMSVIREFKVTKQNVDEIYTSINQEIDSLSNQFKKIHVFSNGYTNHDGGEIIVQLAYCVNSYM